MVQTEYILEDTSNGKKHIFKSSLNIHKLNSQILHNYSLYRKNPRKYKQKKYFQILKYNNYKLYKKDALERLLKNDLEN